MIGESKTWGCVPTSTIWSGLHVSVNFFCLFPSASCDKKTKDGPLRSPEGKRDQTTINKKWTNKVLPFWIISHFHCSHRLIINNLTSSRSPRVIMRCFDERLTEGGGYSYRLPNKLSNPWQNHSGNYYSFKIIMMLFSPRNLLFSLHHILYNIPSITSDARLSRLYHTLAISFFSIAFTQVTSLSFLLHDSLSWFSFQHPWYYCQLIHAYEPYQHTCCLFFCVMIIWSILLYTWSQALHLWPS